MKIKRCRCRHCNYGFRSSWGSFIAKYYVQKERHKVKQMLKKGKWEDIPIYIYLPYTD
jgi:hypothetical protein